MNYYIQIIMDGKCQQKKKNKDKIFQKGIFYIAKGNIIIELWKINNKTYKF